MVAFGKRADVGRDAPAIDREVTWDLEVHMGAVSALGSVLLATLRIGPRAGAQDPEHLSLLHRLHHPNPRRELPSVDVPIASLHTIRMFDAHRGTNIAFAHIGNHAIGRGQHAPIAAIGADIVGALVVPSLQPTPGQTNGPRPFVIHGIRQHGMSI